MKPGNFEVQFCCHSYPIHISRACRAKSSCILFAFTLPTAVRLGIICQKLKSEFTLQATLLRWLNSLQKSAK